MLSRVFSGTVLCLALIWAGAGAARADERGADGQSLDRILPGIREHHPGRFYDAQGPMPGPDGQMRYRIKWMTPDGRIVWFDADARTGRVLGSDDNRREFAPPGTFDRSYPPPDDRRDERRPEPDIRHPRFDNGDGGFGQRQWPDRGSVWRDRGEMRPHGDHDYGRGHY